MTACATPPEPRPDASAPPARPDGALEVRLEFGEQADLDLFVTDPGQETVYFGNNPSLGGGQLHADQRCDAASPRAEQVLYLAPKPGRYRVGVEYNRSCLFRRNPAEYRIVVRSDGVEQIRQGEIEAGRFEHIALEFDFGEESARDH